MLLPHLLSFLLAIALNPIAIAALVSRPSNEVLQFDPRIRPSEIHKHIHPHMGVDSSGNVNCAGTQEAFSSDGTGKVIGCLFTYSYDTYLQAVHAISMARNLSKLEPPQLENTPDIKTRLGKRDTWTYTDTNCYHSGIYVRLDDFRGCYYSWCPIIDGLAGTYITYGLVAASFYGPIYPVPPSVFANSLARIDFVFSTNLLDDPWVYSDIKGRCNSFYNAIVAGPCVGGSGSDSQGGWAYYYDTRYGSGRRYLVGQDPNVADISGGT
ncbi:hypothetical protein AA313_de0202430 [Arthrobotrys entomopaga]|nr:hypothetical protein AA313_de0202430 [Arthrobotrys entomopaga]